MSRFAAAGILIAAFALLAVVDSRAQAGCDNTVPAELTVNTINDNALCTATCSLRGAILRANTACAAVQIHVPAGTYAIASALPLTAPQTLVGDGSGQTFIDAGKKDRVLSVQSDVTLSGVTLTHGQVTGRGGGVSVTAGTVTLSDVVLSANQASLAGGGIAIEAGAIVNAQRCELSGNTAAGGGGAVVAGTWSLSDGLIASNTSSSDGGGVRSDNGGVVTLVRTQVAGNTALSGGGLSGAFSLQASTLSGNHASAGDGGGILQSTGALNLQNVTPSGNSASGAGGGVRVSGLTSDTWDSVTISANQAASGGGIALTATGGLSMSGAVVTANTAATDADCASVALSSGGHNLITPSAGCHIAASGTDVTGDAKLLPLADNGGPTLTHALGAGSAAIDAGANGLGADARGVSRPQGLANDVGAFERGLAVLLVSTTSTPQTAATGSAVVHTYRVRNLGPTPAVQVSTTATGSLLAASASSGICAGAVCVLSAIAPGASADVTLVVTGDLTSTLSVNADNGADVAAQLATTATPSADLVLSAAPLSSAVDLGTQTQIALTVLNHGPSDAQAVSVTASAGTETFLVAAPVAPVTCTVANNVVTCGLGTLASGASQTVAVALSASALGSLTVHAAAASSVSDPDMSNNVLDQVLAVTGVDASNGAPASSASGVAQASNSATIKGCSALPAAWWCVSLAAWWRRPRRSSSRR